MKKIENIAELISVLKSYELHKSENCYLNAMRRTDISLKKWEDYFAFDKYIPKRICISKTSNYELFLSCWEKGQEGPIHDINSEEAWIHPICGRFIEERYKLSNHKLEQVSSVLLTPQSYSYMQKSKTIYKYINAYEARSVCLHLFSLPVKERNEYDKETGIATLVENEFDVMDIQDNHEVI